MKKSLFFGLVAILGLIGCSRNQEIDVPEANLSLFARTESPAESRTVVESGTHVFWEPGDEIAVFMGEKTAKFTTDITAASGTATFKGTFGDSEWPEEPDIWAVYPYSEDAVFDGETITTTLPSEQIAREGSFGKDMNLSIAHSNSSTLQFYNVGGGIRFRLTQEGIKKISFEGYGGEILTGTVKIGLEENGLPQIREVTDGSKVITLLPPTGIDSFPTNTWFYCVAIPSTLASGYKLEFYRESEYSRKVSDRAVTIKRSIFGSIDNADEGCVFIPIPNTITTPEAVDLGLSVKWASFNLGASSPEEYGDYYAWGETEPYYSSLDPLTWKEGKEKGYCWSSYKWCMGTRNTLTKYCSLYENGYKSFTDTKTVLDLEDDAAHANLGGNWRMPTNAEWTELKSIRNKTWTSQNGVDGMLITSGNGNSIFLPAAGHREGTGLYFYGGYGGDVGMYWSSSLNRSRNIAMFTSFDSYYFDGEVGDVGTRCCGLSVRPVYAE